METVLFKRRLETGGSGRPGPLMRPDRGTWTPVRYSIVQIGGPTHVVRSGRAHKPYWPRGQTEHGGKTRKVDQGVGQLPRVDGRRPDRPFRCAGAASTRELAGRVSDPAPADKKGVPGPEAARAAACILAPAPPGLVRS